MPLAFFVIAIAALIALGLFGMIGIGIRNQRTLESTSIRLGDSASGLETTSRHLLETLDQLAGEQARLTQRMENVETIVTSEAWDAIHKGATAEEVGLLEDESPPDPSSEAKASQIARRVR